MTSARRDAAIALIFAGIVLTLTCGLTHVLTRFTVDDQTPARPANIHITVTFAPRLAPARADRSMTRTPHPTAPAVTPHPTPTAAPTTPTPTLAPAVSGSAMWDRVADCESGGQWHRNDGAYDGGLQFSARTWVDYGGAAYAPTADRATRTEQIAVANKVLAAQGVNAWPVCGPREGLHQ